MNSISRRDFLKMGASLGAMMGLSSLYTEALAEGLEELAAQRHRVLWLAGQSCSGCSVSFLNSTSPGPAAVITQVISLAFHATVGAAQGEVAMDVFRKNVQNPGYILIFEGSIPLAMPEACMFGERPLEYALEDAIRNAKAVVAIGTCAAFGGMPAAEGNPTGAVSLKKFMEARRFTAKDIQDKVIALPTCPTHPESLIGSLVYYIKFGMPERDPEYLRPKIFYRNSIHAECPRYHHYQNQSFASEFGDEEGCLFKLGCLGPLSFAQCARRQWNNGINWCIRANAPCISCSSEHFCASKDLPFYRKGEKYQKRT